MRKREIVLGGKGRKIKEQGVGFAQRGKKIFRVNTFSLNTSPSLKKKSYFLGLVTFEFKSSISFKYTNKTRLLNISTWEHVLAVVLTPTAPIIFAIK